MMRRTAEVMKILAIVSVFVFSFASCSPDMFLPEKKMVKVFQVPALRHFRIMRI